MYCPPQPLPLPYVPPYPTGRWVWVPDPPTYYPVPPYQPGPVWIGQPDVTFKVDNSSGETHQ